MNSPLSFLSSHKICSSLLELSIQSIDGKRSEEEGNLVLLNVGLLSGTGEPSHVATKRDGAIHEYANTHLAIRGNYTGAGCACHIINLSITCMQADS